MKISQTIIVKILLSLIVILLIIGFFGFRSIKKDLNIELDAHQQLIKDTKEQKRYIIDSVQESSLKEVKMLKDEINGLSKYSNSLIIKIKQYEKNPYYDIDYITAVDILTRSNYSERSNDTIKRKNN